MYGYAFPRGAFSGVNLAACQMSHTTAEPPQYSLLGSDASLPPFRAAAQTPD